ncbi:hypothetical protein EIN_050580 [Entamoeba invadens IP1]|uniref:Formate transporter n=1 Tax=Entamoeba invadens IP1 TaxID=370355 RepID=L7FL98_ENTIV|nr:hypothetical protein EIN_050580 [Entamoeba invadens IP1]ELP87053.1 hypothetical protein EIN_050580 [Entamoeba invadens IP1]|eukprot:XP_004253824.1 hypothetical protein EIN_050580 [Entamoeba invadens IP1]
MNNNETDVEIEMSTTVDEKCTQPETVIPQITKEDLKLIETSQFINFHVTMQQIVSVGTNKTRSSVLRTFSLSILAGMFMAIGAMMAISVGRALPNVDNGAVKFIFGLFLSIGLNIVVLTNCELFTSNCAIVIPSLLSGNSKWYNVIKIHVISYFGNFIGAVFVAVYFGKFLGTFESEIYTKSLFKLGINKTTHHWGKAVLSGIGCNWVVSTGVFMSNCSRDIFGKVAVVTICVMTFVTLGFEHCVANMFFLPTAQMYGADITLGQILWKNIIPVSLGNFIGGTFFVGVPFWFAHVSNVYNFPIIDKSIVLK